MSLSANDDPSTSKGGERPSGRKSAKKREEIVRAAIEVINAKSFALATMADIAARLDLRDATLYYYFSNKQALAYECHVRSLERFERLLGSADASGGTGIEKIRRLIEGLLAESIDKGPQLYFGDYSYLEDLQRTRISFWADDMRGRLQAFIEEGMADGSVVRCESELVVQLMLGMIIWLAKWTPAVKGLTPERLMESIGAFAFHGMESRA